MTVMCSSCHPVPTRLNYAYRTPVYCLVTFALKMPNVSHPLIYMSNYLIVYMKMCAMLHDMVSKMEHVLKDRIFMNLNVFQVNLCQQLRSLPHRYSRGA